MNHPALPPSFAGNGFLFAAALAALTSIATLSVGVCGWMLRDIWLDRNNNHPKTLLFAFRTIFALVSFTAFIRTAPEVIYLQVYGYSEDQKIQHLALSVKRVADTSSLIFFTLWLTIFTIVYPHICLALRWSPNAKYVAIDAPSIWPRLVRPFLAFILIVLVSCLIAYSKVTRA